CPLGARSYALDSTAFALVWRERDLPALTGDVANLCIEQAALTHARLQSGEPVGRYGHEQSAARLRVAQQKIVLFGNVDVDASAKRLRIAHGPLATIAAPEP